MPSKDEITERALQTGVKGTKDGLVWLNDLELEDVQVKWSFSHFDGRAGTFNDEGDHNFTIILDPEFAETLLEVPDGWNVKKYQPADETEPPEYTLSVKISYRFEAPKIFFIRGDRKYKANQEDLGDIRRSSAEKINIVVTPSRWVNGNRTGVSAYLREMYVTIRESRFADEYRDYEEA